MDLHTLQTSFQVAFNSKRIKKNVSCFQIVEVLELIARKEKIELPRQLAERIAINSKKNLRQAIRSFEASWHHKFGFILLIQRQMHMYMGICIHIYVSLLEEDQIILTGWEDDIAYIAKSIVEKQNPKQYVIELQIFTHTTCRCKTS
ncbi:hypothetical protein Hdeb2414_s0339g00871931 [Helianthus debilis subsp. tardiflorus]